MKLMFSDKIKTLKLTKKVPSVILITGLREENRLEQLELAAAELESQSVTEAKGNKIVLSSEPGVSIKVDDVRDLLKKMSLRNWAEGSSRYVLIPHAELLTVQSSNALLKSLEEAPRGTYFLMAAPSKKNLLKTIVSRSFAIYVADIDQSEKEETAFGAAFFDKDSSALTALNKADLKRDWDKFSIKLKDNFCDKVYSGEIDTAEWYRLFDFMSEIDQKIGAHTDTKWLASSIERFGFNG
jgi:hypothetical protein